MKTIFLLLIFSVFTTISAATLQLKITDANDNQVQLITDKKQLNRFDYFWSQKQPVNKPHNYQWRYQLIIEQQSGTSKWVYDLKGFAREISLHQSTVIYQLGPIRSFNNFLNKE